MPTASRADVPWGKDLPDGFSTTCCPMPASTSGRDDWRKDFYDRFMPKIKECKSTGEAAILLNKEIFRQFDVHYSRHEAAQARSESLRTVRGTLCLLHGLSVLAVAAGGRFRRRAVDRRPRQPQLGGGLGRLVHVIGSSESQELDHAWFTDKAAQADASTR